MSRDSMVSRRVLADQVKDHVLHAIRTGRYPLGSRIVETHLARELGVSQQPVREALRGLEALGVVEILSFRGARVRRPTAAELLEGYAVQFALEALGAQLAVPLLVDADIADLEALEHEMQAAAARGDGRALAIADASFHGTLIRIAANSSLERVWQTLEPDSRTYITVVSPGADAQWSADLHLPILDAVRRRDAELVVLALRRHFDLIAAHLRANWAGMDDNHGAESPFGP